MEIHIIVVGKLKNKEIEVLENDYLKRTNSPKVKIHEVKSKQEDVDLEAKEVLNKISSLDIPYNILLTETGKEFDSPGLSKEIFSRLQTFGKISLIIAGAAGPGEKLKRAVQGKLSLSKLTFPHKIARLVLVEQIYRAVTIKNHHPYHK